MNKFAKVLAISLCLNLFCGNISAIGELDTTFNLTGRVFTSFGTTSAFLSDIAIQPDGKIVAVGDFFNGSNYDIAVARYNTDGSLDTSFDGDGKVITAIGNGSDSAKAVAVQPDGKIVVAGSSISDLINCRPIKFIKLKSSTNDTILRKASKP